MKKENPTRSFPVRLPVALIKRLKKKAADEDKTMTIIVTRILENALNT